MKEKTVLLQGTQGERGATGTDETLPINSIIWIEDEEEIPEGFEEV